MITATEGDIGRRVIYDARPVLDQVMGGKIVGVDGRYALVLFDHAVKNYPENPPVLRVGSNLRWAAPGALRQPPAPAIGGTKREDPKGRSEPQHTGESSE